MIYKFPTLSYEGLDKRIKDNQKKMIQSAKKYGENYEQYFDTKEYKKLLKKIRKAVYLKERYGLFENYGTEHLMNHFRNQRDYDSWEDVYVFNTNDLEVIKEELEEMYVPIDGSEPFYSEYDCTGRTMFSRVNIYQMQNRIVVTQSGSLDV